MSEKSRSRFEVIGGYPLSGIIEPQGNKNEAMPVLAASCLTDETVELSNMPEIQDVHHMREILERMGVHVEPGKGGDYSRLKVKATGNIEGTLPRDLCAKLRGSVLLAGPLLARCGYVFLPRPGGDRIGRRRLDTHMLAFEALGAKVSIHPDGFEIRADELKGADILLDEASVTATENAVCAAVLAKGDTVIHNAAAEPHVQGVCRLLVAMGAKIEGIGSNVLHIHGVNKLHGAKYQVGPDYLEVGSFIALAAVTGGELIIKNAGIDDLRMIRYVFSRMGIDTRAEDGNLIVPKDQSLKIACDLGGAIPKIDDAPWPGFPADMTSVALVTATQCKGTVLIHEKMFESRLFFVDHLISMGARIVLCDPHRALVMGPEKLSGATLVSPDIRAGMALLMASLCAEGKSEIQNVSQIDRGFTRIDERLRSLGAQITRKD
jgi:UDP-N-acetylglucosamine 1-carboxyvinyltransferase